MSVPVKEALEVPFLSFLLVSVTAAIEVPYFFS
jgi:hypothetical protein